MTQKLNNYKPTPLKDLTMDYLNISPYANIACEIFKRKGITEPNAADLFEAFHAIAKIDNKINRKIK